MSEKGKEYQKVKVPMFPTKNGRSRSPPEGRVEELHLLGSFFIYRIPILLKEWTFYILTLYTVKEENLASSNKEEGI